MSKLFIIGNGFDIEHGLPTKFNLDFKEIVEKNEQNKNFWEIYQSCDNDIWSDFEHSLANPDFNNLIEIFDGYYPDYMSDHENDRDGIITQVELNGKLKDSLYEFANQAENKINCVSPLEKYKKVFIDDGIFINFNYTHTIEKLYDIQINKIIHIHGEVGKNNLILGYPEEEYNPEKYVYDVRQHGRGPYIKVNFEKYIENEFKEGSMDYYVYTAYTDLIKKTKSFKKTVYVDVIRQFIKDKNIDEIHIFGHSCSIDYEYFELINDSYPNAMWYFNPFKCKDKDNMINLIEKYSIRKYSIKELGENIK